MFLRAYNLCLIILVLGFIALIKGSKNSPEENTVLIGISVRNREVILPYFLSFFHRLSFPKEKIFLIIMLGKSDDRTEDIIKLWLKNYGQEYKNVDIQQKTELWDMHQMREDILNRARDIRVDYVMLLEPVAFITEKNTIQYLIRKRKVVVAGMLRSSDLYSNFWGEMTEDFDYKRSFLYKQIYSRNKLGCFKAALVHGCVLIALRKAESGHLSFLGPGSYAVALALSARAKIVPMFICNDRSFGFIIKSPLYSGNYDMEEEISKFREAKNLIHKGLNILDPLEIFITSGFVRYPKIDNLGMDQIYIINLLKSLMKKKVMEERLKEVGLEAHFFEAVNGLNLNSTYLMSIGANQLKSYDDIYMTLGAMGAFLSHYFIWENMIKNNNEMVIVLEDDTEFGPNFKEIIKGALQELEQKQLDWEFLFINRGTPMGPLGDSVKNCNYLREVGNGMLSISGYLLNLKGARKLATSTVIAEMLPVDEYILMLHSPQYRELRGWDHNYGPCDLKVYLIEPEPSYNVPFSDGFGSITDTLHSPRTDDNTFGVPIGQKVSKSKDEL